MLLNRVLLMVLVLKASSGHLHNNGSEPASLFGDFMAEMWIDGAQMARMLWFDCTAKAAAVHNETLTTADRYQIFTECLKTKTLKALDRSLNTDVITLADGVHLIKYEKIKHNGNVVYNNNSDTYLTENVIKNNPWQYLVLQRMAKVLNSHVLKVDVGQKNGETDPEVQTHRGRRRQHQMMQMMIFGIVSLGMIIIPMGFQFLAVLGGKALLIAKFALILSSIQGLKKVATSPLNYGLYSYQPQSHHLPDLSTFEQRAHGSFVPHHPQDTMVDAIKYRYNSATNLWKAEPSVFQQPQPQPQAMQVQAEVTEPPHPVFDPYMAQGSHPTDRYSDYTIELPVNKLQLKTLH